jgi:hypothetical protein
MDDRPLMHRVTERASDPAARALLHGDVHDEVGRVLAAMESEDLKAPAGPLPDEELLERIARYEALVAGGGGENRGAPTPNLDELAAEGLQVMSFAASRAATPAGPRR